MDIDKLAYMANQIGDFFIAQGDGAAAAILDHIKKFWDPRMRGAILEHLDEVSGDLRPAVLAALQTLKSQAKRKRSAA